MYINMCIQHEQSLKLVPLMSDHHFHFLLRGTVSMTYNCYHTTQLQPKQKKVLNPFYRCNKVLSVYKFYMYIQTVIMCGTSICACMCLCSVCMCVVSVCACVRACVFAFMCVYECLCQYISECQVLNKGQRELP